jgi:TPP-dependent pyruvate/acetoin dehydrogenase alpha subunit
MPSARATALDSIADRAKAFGFPGVEVDGMDVLAVRGVVGEAVARARAGEGPTLVVAHCYRFEGHHVGDLENYRTASDADPWHARDPIPAFRARLVEAGILDEAAADAIAAEEAAAVAASVEHAEADPLPEPAAAWTDIVA